MGHAGSCAVAVCHQSARAGVDVGGHGIGASHAVNGLAISIVAGLCHVTGNASVQVGDLFVKRVYE